MRDAAIAALLGERGDWFRHVESLIVHMEISPTEAGEVTVKFVLTEPATEGAPTANDASAPPARRPKAKTPTPAHH